MAFPDISPRFSHVIDSLRDADKIRVLFVCLGNICRSPAADGVMKAIIAENPDQKHRWVIDSAGTGRYHIGQLPDHRMRVHARRRGIELDHICRQVTADDFSGFDLIIPMDASNESCLRQLAPSPEALRKIVPMATFVGKAMRADHIPDPYYEGAEGFELVLDLLDDGCRNLFNILTPRQ